MNPTEIENFIIGRLYCGKCAFYELVAAIREKSSIKSVLEQSIRDDLRRLIEYDFIVLDNGFYQLTVYGIQYYELFHEIIENQMIEPEKTFETELIEVLTDILATLKNIEMSIRSR